VKTCVDVKGNQLVNVGWPKLAFCLQCNLTATYFKGNPIQW